MSTPVFTIITPCYNHEPYLKDYFRGLLAQHYSNVELFILDDGSTDRSWEIIKANEPRLRRKFAKVVLQTGQNVGALSRLAKVSSEFTGDWVSVLESDDYYSPERLERTVRFLSNRPNIKACRSLFSTEPPETPTAESSSSVTLADLLHENSIRTCSFTCSADLFRQHVDFDRYLSKGYRMGDYPMFMDIAQHAKIVLHPERLVTYRTAAGSASRSSSARSRFLFERSYLDIKREYLSMYTGPQKERLRERLERQWAVLHLKQGHTAGFHEERAAGLKWLRRHRPKDFGKTRHLLLQLVLTARAALQVANDR